MKLPVYNCIVDESTEDATGVYAISFVDCPANEVEFVKLRRQQSVELMRDEQKQILTGVVLMPDQLIYRKSPQMGEYYIKFSAQEIEKIARKMMRTGVALHNTTHQHQLPLKDNYMTELWIVENPDQDKSHALGFDNLPQGTLMCSYKIGDKKYWDEQVMAGHVRGFSLEGLFNQEIALSKYKPKSDQTNAKMNKSKRKPTLLGRLANLLLDIEDVQKKDATTSGEAFVVFVLADGKEVFIDQDGFATLEDEQMPAGEHKLANGNLLVIDAQGQFIETKVAVLKTTNPDQATPKQTLGSQKTKPADVKPEFVDALKAKIAEMQQTIDEMNEALDQAQGSAKKAKEEVEKLRRRMPSAYPAYQAAHVQKVAKDMTAAERMAVALSESLYRKKK